MGTKTGKIRYNVQERGRQHIGRDRNLDTRALASLVNGPAVQERVKNRDLMGYYGHWIRMKFGLRPPESVVVDGKQVSLEPAIVTTSLSADNDGNIEHETEFLDTPSGKVAARLHNSKTGGFSSAIHAVPGRGIDVPTIFAGFDYVLEPNFTTNRGYMFDSVDGLGEDVIFDSIMSEWSQGNAAMTAIYDSLNADHYRALETMDRLREENEELLSMLAVQRPGNGAALFDSVHSEGTRPMIVSKSAANDLLRRAAAFNSGQLVGFDKLPEDK